MSLRYLIAGRSEQSDGNYSHKVPNDIARKIFEWKMIQNGNCLIGKSTSVNEIH